ncbi:MAG: LysE family translocator [Pseudomonadota bacterium]
MPNIELLVLFAVTTFVVVLTPGPAALAVVTESAKYGVARGILVISGVASANALFFALSATGISALILASSTLFTAIKWLGVAYLVWIGLQAIFSRAGNAPGALQSPPRKKARQVFMRGFIIEMANPKAFLYFAALLPQFIDPAQPVLAQLLLFGVLTVLIDFSVYIGYSVLASMGSRTGLKPAVTNWLNRLAGGLLIFAGVKMAQVER